MKIIDITRKLDENVMIYEGDPKFVASQIREIEADGYEISKLSMGSHTGTHLDAPCHFILEGRTAYELPLSYCVGDCVVVDDLEEIDGTVKKALWTSKKGGGRLTSEEAEMLIEKGIHLIGTEKLSIGGDEIHRKLLGNGCIILEALDLKKAEAKKYFLSAAPLKMDADGSPLRAYLIDGE